MNTALLLSLLTAAQAPAPPPSPAPPKVAEVVPLPTAKPEEFTVSVGKLKRIKAEEEKARWELQAGTTGAEIITDEKGGVAFTAERPGRYTLICYSSGPALWVIITVTGSDPGPAPGPTPPGPTPPAPPAPPRPSPVAVALREAFAADQGDAKQKKEDAAQLAALWAEAIRLCDDKEVKTVADLLERLRKAVGMLVADRLPKTRLATAEAKRALFGTVQTPLTEERRAEAKKLFKTFQDTLEDLSR